MNAKLYTDGEDYYLPWPSPPGALHWRCENKHWTSVGVEMPSGVTAISLADLPADLREEIMAFATRAAAMGHQIWGAGN